MLTRIMTLTAASMLLLTSGAWAEGVIAGQTTEVKRIDRAKLGPSSYVKLADGRVFKLTAREAAVLAATQFILPEAIVALPAAEPVSGRRTSSMSVTPVIAASMARGADPAPVVIITRDRGLDAGTTANVFPADVVGLSTLQPGNPVVVAGGEPIVREDGYYVRGAESDKVVLQSVRLTNGKWVTIRDRVHRTAAIDGDVDFNPAALQPGKYVSLIKRDDGSYFLSAAPAPRARLVGVPSGKVNRVDSRAQVIEMSDGTFVHPLPHMGAVLQVRDQPVDLSALRPGTWVVIDPNPTLAVDAPSALPADIMMSGQLLDVR